MTATDARAILSLASLLLSLLLLPLLLLLLLPSTPNSHSVSALFALLHPGFYQTADAAKRVYVNCDDGSDESGDGSKMLPWRTLTRARDEIRRFQRRFAVEVLVQGTCLPRDQHGRVDFALPLLELEHVDSGSEGRPIEYASQHPHRPALLSSGLRIPHSAWRRLVGEIFTANLTALGVSRESLGSFLKPTSTGGDGLGNCTWNMTELFFGGTPMTLARYPNVNKDGTFGWMQIERVLNDQTEFSIASLRAKRWRTEKDVWIHGYWGFDWADSHLPVRSLQFSSNETFVSVGAPVIYGFKPRAKFYAVNLKSELDSPGEYFIDKEAMLLYFWPPGDLHSQEAVLSMGHDGILIGANHDQVNDCKKKIEQVKEGTTSGGGGINAFSDYMANKERQKKIFASCLGEPAGKTSHITFKNIQISYQRRAAVQISRASHIRIINVSVSNIGKTGMDVDGSDILISSTNVSFCGCGGIALNGGNTTSLTRSNNEIELADIHNFARIRRSYTPGIGWRGGGHSIRQSHIHHAPHSGILGLGNDCEFDGNIFESLAFEATDTGAWYSGRSWINRGNIISRNRFVKIRNTVGMNLGFPAVMGIYLDDMLSGISITNNSFEDVQVGVFVGGSRDVSIVSNRFFNVSQAGVKIDDRGLNWRSDICRFDSNFTGLLAQQLLDVNFLFPPFATSYPSLPPTLSLSPCSPVLLHILNNKFCKRLNSSEQFIDAPQHVIKDPLNVITMNSFAC